jgi:hypothetical protein
MRVVGYPSVLCVLAAVALSACGSGGGLPDPCRAMTVADVLHALRHAPGQVALADGTRLSTCVQRATGDADLQTVGATLTAAADRLARGMARSDAAALQLGYLMGATERGAARTPGVQAELSARMGQAAGFDGGPRARRAALLRGRAAGRRGG